MRASNGKSKEDKGSKRINIKGERQKGEKRGTEGHREGEKSPKVELKVSMAILKAF